MNKLFFYTFPLCLTLFVVAGLNTSKKQTENQLSMASEAFDIKLNKNISKEIDELILILNDPQKFNAHTCSSRIDIYYEKLLKTPPNYFEISKFNSDYNDLMKKLMSLKINLTDKISEYHESKSLNSNCINSIRKGLRTIRYVEDYIILTARTPIPFRTHSDPTAPALVADNDTELEINSKFNNQLNGQKLFLRSGDVLLSRGNTFISASIARVESEETQFSHLAQVYIDAPVGTEIDIVSALSDRRVKVIESHPEIGVVITTFANYSLEGNTRILLYRPKEIITADIAHSAAKSVFDYVNNYKEDKRAEAHRKRFKISDNLPYDFKMDMYQNEALFCSEVIYVAYKKMGLTVPTYPSKLKQNNFLKELEVKAVQTFAPSDIEIEPQFELVAEWRDIRKIDGAIRKDRIMSSLYRWSDEGSYSFEPNRFQNAISKIAFQLRKHNIALKKLLSKQLTPEQIAIFISITLEGSKLEKKLVKFEKDFVAENNGVKPSFYDLSVELEKYK